MQGTDLSYVQSLVLSLHSKTDPDSNLMGLSVLSLQVLPVPA